MAQLGPRRRPSSGGYARGDEKRLLIIQAAVRAFGEHGFEGASTRQIAQDAGVNPPALQYYFDGKEGLHRACAEYIVGRVGEALQDGFAKAEAITPESPREDAVAALCNIMDVLADFIFDTASREGLSRFMARGQGQSSEPSYHAMKRAVSARLHETCAGLVAHALSLPADDPEARVRSMAIIGQFSIFHLAAQNALDFLGWPDIRDERLQYLKGIIRGQTEAILSRPAVRPSAATSPTLLLPA